MSSIGRRIEKLEEKPSRGHAAPEWRQFDLHRRIPVPGRSAGDKPTRHHATRVYSRYRLFS
jgi:hypothetical protein